MVFSDYIAQNQAFTTADLLDASDNAPSARVALSRAVKAGKVAKVRTGLYVSNAGRYLGASVDPHLVAATLCPDAVFVYHSALELHGLAHSASRTLTFMCKNPPSPFSFQGIGYKGLPARPGACIDSLSAKAFGTVATTTREQTFVDCMAKMRWAGGAEEVVRSFAGLPYADIGEIVRSLDTYPPSVAARVGWYLEANQTRWRVPDEALDAIQGLLPEKASYKLDPTYKKFAGYNAKWHLSLPAPIDEITD